MNYFKKRKLIKGAHEALRHARHVRHMREDIMSDKDLDGLKRSEDRLIAYLDEQEYESLEKASARLMKRASALMPQMPMPVFAENLEVVVVALAVAMAVKAYFIQPFKIPTSSMAPTLSGIELQEDYEPGIFDIDPLKRIKWIITGRMYKEVIVQVPGEMGHWYDDGSLNINNNPVYKYVDISGVQYKVPEKAESVYSAGEMVEKGDVIWKGVMISGDHVFVDKVSWNFRRPRRGEIMVFRTQGIGGIGRGDHYIKRLVGMPGETIKLIDSELFANGVKIAGPDTITRIMSRTPPYTNGYTYVDRSQFFDKAEFNVPENGYMAMGDNSAHSSDSRYWGPVPEQNMMGPALLVYWPFWPFNKHWGIANR